LKLRQFAKRIQR
jgi:hypothetical protein